MLLHLQFAMDRIPSTGFENSQQKDKNTESNHAHQYTHLGKRASRDLEAMIPLSNATDPVEDTKSFKKQLLLLDCPPAVLRKRNLLKDHSEFGGTLVDLDAESYAARTVESVTVPIIVGKAAEFTLRAKRSSIKGASVSSLPSHIMKKSTSFADNCGQRLAVVHEILNQEDPPEIPKNAFQDLSIPSSSTNLLPMQSSCSHIRALKRLFLPPSLMPDFLKIALIKHVLLESCDVNSTELTVNGTIRVANISYTKVVIVRWTTNNWLTFTDYDAKYLNSAPDHLSDRFTFTIKLPVFLETGMRLEFAIKYETIGNTYWDNNNGTNYMVDCISVLTYPGFSKRLSNASLI